MRKSIVLRPMLLSFLLIVLLFGVLAGVGAGVVTADSAIEPPGSTSVIQINQDKAFFDSIETELQLDSLLKAEAEKDNVATLEKKPFTVLQLGSTALVGFFIVLLGSFLGGMVDQLILIKNSIATFMDRWKYRFDDDLREIKDDFRRTVLFSIDQGLEKIASRLRLIGRFKLAKRLTDFIVIEKE